jgi:hypothetical protein
MEVRGQLHASAALPPRKEPLVPIGWEAGLVPESGRTLYAAERNKVRDKCSARTYDVSFRGTGFKIQSTEAYILGPA